jgi:hypothetical protein
MFSWLKAQFAGRPSPAPSPAEAAAAAPPPAAFELVFGQAAAPRPASAGPAQVVLVGNCIAEMMAKGLSSVPEAAKRFDFFVVPLRPAGIDEPETARALARCKFVFLQNVAADSADKVDALRNGGSEVVALPDAVLRSVWPFDGASGNRDPAVVAANPNAPKHAHDGALAALRLVEPDKKKRLQRYRELDFALARSIDRVIASQARFLEGVDRTNDAGIGQFIERHYREQRLFYNSTHPSGRLFQEICGYCWRKLDLPGPVPAIANMDFWRTWSVPVHPLIARRLGLTWVDEHSRYNYGDLGEVTWEEWAGAYIDRYG